MSVTFCTLAIHEPYRSMARQLCADMLGAPLVVLTDVPTDFSDLPVVAIHHVPTGPMAIDYLERIGPTGNNNGAAAYHDKRFALAAALALSDTAVYLDADSRIVGRLDVPPLLAGVAVVPVVTHSIAEHLKTCGTWRLPAFQHLARQLTGTTDVLESASWCHETLYAVTRDGREDQFFAAWDQGATYMQTRGVFSGEGGVMGLAAACAGWPVDHQRLAALARLVAHQGGGPKHR